jgi:hypothetical protein
LLQHCPDDFSGALKPVGVFSNTRRKKKPGIAPGSDSGPVIDQALICEAGLPATITLPRW